MVRQMVNPLRITEERFGCSMVDWTKHSAYVARTVNMVEIHEDRCLFQIEEELLHSTTASRNQKQVVIERVANVHDVLNEADGLRDQIHHVDKTIGREKAGIALQVWWVLSRQKTSGFSSSLDGNKNYCCLLTNVKEVVNTSHKYHCYSW